MSDRSVMRAEMREVVEWLKGAVFAEARSDKRGQRVFRDPAGWRVVVLPRQDLTGVSGWIERPDGTAVVNTSRLDVQTLEEHIP